MAIAPNKGKPGKNKQDANEDDKDGEGKAKVNFAGTWQGNINALGLKVVFRIKKTDDDYTAKTDSPNQNAYGIGTEITVTGEEVELEIRTPNPSSFSGRLNGKTIEGTVAQGGGEWPLKLRKQ